jgi:hypothetical protein
LRCHEVLGKPTAAEKLLGLGAVGAAAFTAMTLKLNLFQHPKLIRREYRHPQPRPTPPRWKRYHRTASVASSDLPPEPSPSRM